MAGTYVNTFRPTTQNGAVLAGLASMLFGNPAQEAKDAAAAELNQAHMDAYEANAEQSRAAARKALAEEEATRNALEQRQQFATPESQLRQKSAIAGLPVPMTQQYDKHFQTGAQFPMMLAPDVLNALFDPANQRRYDTANRAMIDMEQANLNPKGNNFDLGQAMERLTAAETARRAAEGGLPTAALEQVYVTKGHPLYTDNAGTGLSQNSVTGAQIDRFNIMPTVAAKNSAAAALNAERVRTEKSKQSKLSRSGSGGAGSLVQTYVGDDADGNPQFALIPKVEGATVTKTGKPEKTHGFSASDSKALDKMVADLFADTPLDAKSKAAVTGRTSEIYQQSGNINTALSQAVQELTGGAAPAGNRDGWFGSDTYSIPTQQPAAAAPQKAPQQKPKMTTSNGAKPKVIKLD